MAENEWYEKHKKDVAAALKKGKTASKDDGVPCTLVRMKDGGGLLCAGVSASKAAALVKEAKAAGGKVLSSGTLYNGDGGPTFAVSDGSTSVKALFAAAAQEALGAPLRVEIIAATVPPPAPPPVPSGDATGDDKARFTDLLKQVRPRFQQAVAADPLNKANLEKGMGMAVAAAKENDFGKGLKVLQALDLALQKTPVAAVPTPPPAPPAPSAPPAAAAAAVQAALAKMVPLVKNAAATNPDRKAELLEPLKRCQDHLKNGQAVEAKAALFDLNRILKELDGAVPPPPTPEVVTKDEAEGEEQQEAEKSETAPDVKGEEEAGDEEEASETAPTTQEEEEKAKPTIEVWVDARDKVIAQMQHLQDALAKEAQESNDSDYKLIADKGLGGVTKRLQVGLHVALMEFDRASGEARAAARTKAQKVVKEFQTFLASDGLVRLAEKNAWGVQVDIQSTLGGALNELSGMLSA